MKTFTRRDALQFCGIGLLVAALPLMPARAAPDAAGLVQALTSQLGITQQQAQGGAGAMFGLAQQRMEPDRFAQVQQSVPGLDGLLAAAPQAGGQTGQGSGGGLGGMAGSALGALGGTGAMGGGGATGGLGGELAALAPLAGSFSQLGLSPEMAGQFLPVIMQYLTGNGAGDTASMLRQALLG